MKTWVIYRHTLKEGFEHSGWSYIGLTCQSLKKRWQNGTNYKNSLIFYKAIKKYGWDNFSHEVIETDIDTLEKANEREKYWILFYHTCILDEACRGYNITWGGDGTSGHKVSAELRQKMSEIKKGTHLSEVTKQKISKSMIGHNISDENLKNLLLQSLENQGQTM